MRNKRRILKEAANGTISLDMFKKLNGLYGTHDKLSNLLAKGLALHFIQVDVNTFYCPFFNDSMSLEQIEELTPLFKAFDNQPLFCYKASLQQYEE